MAKPGDSADSKRTGVELRRQLQKLRRQGLVDLAIRPGLYPALWNLVVSKANREPLQAYERVELCRAVFQDAINALPSARLQAAAAILFHLETDCEAPPLEKRRRAADKAYAGQDIAREPDTIQRTLERDILDPALVEILSDLAAIDVQRLPIKVSGSAESTGSERTAFRVQTAAFRSTSFDEEGQLFETMELGFMARASDLGSNIIEGIGQSVDLLCRAYPNVPAPTLLERTKQRYRQIMDLLSKRLTLTEHRELRA